MQFKETVYKDVDDERVRAHRKHGANGNSRENADWVNNEWLSILVEEIGEVAHELTYDANPIENRQRLRKELIQVAAMACAWIESIDRSGHDPIHIKGDFWYFWNEIWTEEIGPFQSHSVALEAMHDYIRNELNG